MERVVQRAFKKGDCGVACIAMVTGLSYETVEKKFQEHELVEDGKYYTFHQDLIGVLEAFGFTASRKKFVSWDKVETPAIVKVNLRPDNHWHWVVKYGEKKLLDPKPSAPDLVEHYRGRKGSGQYLLISPKVK